MTQPRFDSDIAHDKSTATFAPMSDAGNRPPKVHLVPYYDHAGITIYHLTQ